MAFMVHDDCLIVARYDSLSRLLENVHNGTLFTKYRAIGIHVVPAVKIRLVSGDNIAHDSAASALDSSVVQ